MKYRMPIGNIGYPQSPRVIQL